MNISEITKEITDKTMMSINSGLPVFIIVCYDHEIAKLSLLESIKNNLKKKGIITRTFDPGGFEGHGTDKLYTHLANASMEKKLCIISGLPLNEKNKIQPDNSFIHYLNIHRDRITKETIRMVLFIHTSNAEDFINSAGDLWDFRHGTYWVEREKEKNINFLWETLENRSNELKNENSDDILRHIQKVKSLINNTENNNDKARLLLDLAKWLRRRYANNSAVESAHEALNYIRGKQDTLLAEIEFEIGYCLHLSSNLPEALGHYQKSLKIRQEIGDTKGEGPTLNNISQIYDARGDYDTALSYLEKSLKIRQEIGDTKGEGPTLNNISQIYDARGDYDTALSYLEKSLKIRQEIGDTSGEGATLNNIGSIFKARGDYDTALSYLEKSLKIRQEIGDTSGEAVTCYNLAMEWERRKDIEKAIYYLEITVKIEGQTGHPDFLGDKQYFDNLIKKQQS